MYCGKCGAEIPSNTAFCPNCGNQINTNVVNNKRPLQKDKTKAKKTVKKIIITVLVIALAVTGAYNGFEFYMKLNGHMTAECSYDGIERVSKSICKNIKGGSAKVGRIKSGSDGDYYVSFTVYLSGKQKEDVQIDFYNYDDTNTVGTVEIKMHTSSDDFNGENTYNSYIAIASAVEKTFLAWRYVDEYSEYSSTVQKINELTSGSDDVVLHSYTISDGPEVTIYVTHSVWGYQLKMTKY